MSDYAALTNLLNAYFHQDWMFEADSQDDVVKDFASTNWPDEIEAARADIAAFLLANPANVHTAIEETFMPMVEVGSTDAEARNWLTWLSDRLTEHRALAPQKPAD
ncbi:MAG: contact-dependent growth inhibition system immunity protein [Pseudomonadota bacterium]